MRRTTRIAHLSTSAGIRYRSGDYQGAAADYREALRYPDTLPPMDHLSLLNDLGVVCKCLGAFDEAEGAYRRALDIAEHFLNPDDPRMATLYHNLGGLEHARGRHMEGEPFARRSVEIRERALGPE